VTAPTTLADLEDRLSEPSPAAIEALVRCPGDIIVLGAGGKMGPSLTAMARRAATAAGGRRRVFAVSRFSSPGPAEHLAAQGVEVLRTDLADPDSWATLPDCPNVIYMVGQKFGTTDAPERTWYTNTAIAAFAAARYRHARVVAFSTGNVYPLVSAPGPGSRESDPPGPLGEYAQSCLGRERAFQYAASTWGTRVAVLRLNYAVDLRYGVLVDLALRVRERRPIDLSMGWFNCIWQGDANALALASLGDTTAPAAVFNLTGLAALSVREVASTLGARLGVAPVFTGTEQPTALLSDATALWSRHGLPRVEEATLISWVAAWIQQGGPTSGKPTHFEQREGTF
jgi:nucleoside-diphosphate-sugar epimerase